MIVRALLRNRRASSSAEFALVLPLLLLILFGIIDGGRWLWAYNRAEKATQAGARYAVVTDPIAGGLVTADYIGVGGLTQGDVIPRSALGKVACNNSACCSGTAVCVNPYPAVGTFDTTTFNNIVARMRAIDPSVQASNVTISYEGSGLGYAGDPYGMDVSPIVTVQLSGMTFRPITTLLLANISMPAFATSLTSEDASGEASN